MHYSSSVINTAPSQPILASPLVVVVSDGVGVATWVALTVFTSFIWRPEVSVSKTEPWSNPITKNHASRTGWALNGVTRIVVTFLRPSLCLSVLPSTPDGRLGRACVEAATPFGKCPLTHSLTHSQRHKFSRHSPTYLGAGLGGKEGGEEGKGKLL